MRRSAVGTAAVVFASLAAGCTADGQWSARKALGWEEVKTPSTPKLPRGHLAVGERIDTLGRRIIAQNTFTGIEPTFCNIGLTESVLFHRGTDELFISDGLVAKCKTEPELAAVLCSELGQMMAEKRGARRAGADRDTIPDAWDTCPSRPNPLQEDSDADGTGDACPRRGGPACPGNRVANPSFDDGTSGWIGVDGVLTRHAEESAARICRSGATGTRTFTLEEYPHAVRTVTVGQRFRVEAWVKADSTGPQQLKPVIREIGPNGEHVGDSELGTSGLDSVWQRVVATYAVQRADSTGVLVEFTSVGAPVGSCFLLDDVCFIPEP